MALKSKRPPAAGANRSKKAVPTNPDHGVNLGFVTMVDIDFAEHGLMTEINRRTTIEARLGSKAADADARDRTGQRSLDRMSDDEIRERLFCE